MGSSYLYAPEPTNLCIDPLAAVYAHKFALVIPTLREAATIKGLVLEIIAALESAELPFEILVVDDDSGDGIESALAPVLDSDPRVRLLVRKGERGLAGAILHGWRHTDAEFLAVMDADLQHPPSLLPRLLHSLLSGRDIAIGSRYETGNCLDGWHPLRKLISRTAIWATRPLQVNGLHVCDPMSGYFAVSRSCVEGIDFETRGFKLLLEILVRGRIRSAQELPFTFGKRAGGHSKAGLRVALDYFRLLWKLYRLRTDAKLALQQASAD